MPFKQRWELFCNAFLFLFSKKNSLYIVKGESLHVGEAGIRASSYLKRNLNGRWEHWKVTFDGKKAVGYIDGIKIEEKMS